MNINYESLALFAKFGGAMLGLLLVVWIIALLTPKAAKLIDRLSGKPPKERPERVQDNIKPEKYEVQQAEPVPLSPPMSDNGSSEHTEPPQGGSEKTIDPKNYKVYSIFEDRPKDAK